VAALGLPLRLLVENEMYRLSVWDNPINDTRRRTDYLPATERTMSEVSIFISGIMQFAQIRLDHLARSYPHCVGG
jgi:hypothetical protein